MKKVTDPKVIGPNIKQYIESLGVTQKWIYENIEMSRANFSKLLKGEISHYQSHVANIIEFLNIDDPDFFYYETINIPKSPIEIEQSHNIRNLMAASYHGDLNDGDFIDTLDKLEKIIDFIDTFKTLLEQPRLEVESHQVEEKTNYILDLYNRKNNGHGLTEKSNIDKELQLTVSNFVM